MPVELRGSAILSLIFLEICLYVMEKTVGIPFEKGYVSINFKPYRI
jgi:hypothetical protein